MHRINSLLFLFLFFSVSAAFAQVGQSPLSSEGIGTLNSLATGRNLGMGGVGIGTSHYLYLNSMNPAMLSRNSFYTTFEAGMSVESRTIMTSEFQERSTSGGLDYLSVAFPLWYNRWALNIGLAPYSTVNYDFIDTKPLTGSPGESYTVRNSGSGGTSSAYLATGLRLFKGLSVGARASYIFGSITHKSLTSTNIAATGTPSYIARYYSRSSFSDILLTGGLAYTYQLPGKKNQAIMAGFTYDLASDLSAEKVSAFDRIAAIETPFGNMDDAGEEGSYFLPAKIGAGISYEKLYDFTVAADFTVQNWEDYRNFEGNNEGLGKSYRFALGGEWIPDYSSSRTGTYHKRMTYRLGAQYERTPFILNDKEVNDFGINFGLTLPVRNASSIHTSFLVGQRGNSENNVFSERYFRLSLGVTFNDRWFTKVKYD